MTEPDPSFKDGLPCEFMVRRECELLGSHNGVAGVYECSDEAIGCSVEEWYPEFEIGYYIVDMEYGEMLDHTTDKKVAWAYSLGYDKGNNRSNHVPLLKQSHESQLSDLSP